MSGQSEIFVLGTSHVVASAGVRERLHVDLDEVYAALHPLIARGLVDEAIPLATCGRLELYVATRDTERALRLLRQLLVRRSGLRRGDVVAHSYVHRGEDAARHLFRVAAGLDSVVHGEAQIIGQVREALEHPETRRSEGPVLHRLFQHALTAGKRVRTETAIGRGAVSLAGAALSLLQRDVGSLEPLSALVLGAGDTGTLIARLLRKAGVGRLVIANRTLSRARYVARELGGEAAALEDLEALVREADVVVGAVAGRDDLVTPALLGRIRSVGEPRVRTFIDLAHPRNFDPALEGVPGVRLMDLEHVFRSVEAARDARSAQLPRAEALVMEEVEAFTRWLRSRESVAVLRAVREQVLELARAEADRHARGRPAAEQERIHRIVRSVARTLLHQPTAALRDADPSHADGRRLLESATVLFGVGPGSKDLGERA